MNIVLIGSLMFSVLCLQMTSIATAAEWATPEALRAFGSLGDTVKDPTTTPTHAKPIKNKTKKNIVTQKNAPMDNSDSAPKYNNPQIVYSQNGDSCNTFMREIERIASSTLDTCDKVQVIGNVINETKCERRDVINNARSRFQTIEEENCKCLRTGPKTTSIMKEYSDILNANRTSREVCSRWRYEKIYIFDTIRLCGNFNYLVSPAQNFLYLMNTVCH